MKRLITLLLILPALAVGQSRFGHGGSGGVSVSSLLPIIADSTLWHLQGADTLVTDGALPIKVSGLRVSGTTRLDGTLTMVTTTGEQVQLGTGSDAAPELSSVGDPNTGIRIPGSDILQFNTNGTARATFNATGQFLPVTIADATPEIAGSSDTNTGIRFPGGDKMQFVQNGLNSHTFRPYRYTMTYSDGDSLGITLNGTYVNYNSNTNFNFSIGSSSYITTGSNLTWIRNPYPYDNDSGTTGNLGTSSYKWQNIWGSDNIYLGGKGQTATQYISKENTIAGADSSMMFRVGSDGNPYMRWAAADGDSARIHVRSDSTEIYSKNALVLDAPVVLVGGSNVGVSKIDTVFTATFVPRWLKITSGSKSWYSPVYADTTGKW